MKTKTMVGLGAAALLAAPLLAGCELAGPLLIAEVTGEGDDSASSTASLSVQVESAEGMVAGAPLDPERLRASGERVGQELHFTLSAPDETVLQVLLTQAESSAIDPYTGEGFGGGPEGTPIPRPAEDPEVASLAPEPFAEVTICDAATCRAADDFDLEIVQTADGRSAVVEGRWAGSGEHVRLALRYSEDG